MKVYSQVNKENIRKKQKMYKQNNREKLNEWARKCRQEKKNQSNNNEGTSFVNPQTGDFDNKGNLLIVCEEPVNLFNQGEQECINGEEEQNQIEVKEPIKILEDDTNLIDSNKKIRPFDLNEYPEDDESED
ncbi:unnamed protein product [Meloidogyne enterolobii]|uniref:Uncharacterized protein n=1 Tax=Meloidogyne enterolobii TaxID=390850 RepID=A0ACB0YC71_MELEN